MSARGLGQRDKDQRKNLDQNKENLMVKGAGFNSRADYLGIFGQISRKNMRSEG